MESDFPEQRRQGVSCAQVVIGILTVILLLAVAFSIFVPPFGGIAVKGNITIGISNCRQVIMALRIYSADHGSNYPDAYLENLTSANQVFRELFKSGAIDNEKIFGCPVSKFKPDGDIGAPPNHLKALEPGENHWAMTAGLSDSSSGDIPLVYENPVTSTWPPTWNVDAKGTLTRGRSWSTGIIVGLNDTSVSLQKLSSKSGASVSLQKFSITPDSPPKDLFEQVMEAVSPSTPRILNVEEKP